MTSAAFASTDPLSPEVPVVEVVPEPVEPPVLPSRHVVQPHDTIETIVDRYGLAWQDIAAWNQLPAPYRVRNEGVMRLSPPLVPLPPFTTHVEAATREDINWRKGCPVSPANLRTVWVTYIDFSGVAHEGSITVHRSIAAKTQRIFKKLYDARYRIKAMAPLEINAPNVPDESHVTMSYNCRKMTHGSSYSRHSYGTAIDVNPGQNPYVNSRGVIPSHAAPWKSRASYKMGIIHKGGTVVRAFASEGMKWGGSWRTVKDYMHFSTDGH